MKSEQLMTLALRVVAVVIAAYACADLANIVAFLLPMFHWMKPGDMELAFLGENAVVLWSIPIIVAVLLWWSAPMLARLACGRSGPEMNLSGLNVEGLTHGAFIVVGVWVLIFGVIDLARIGVNELQAVAEPKTWVGHFFPWGYFTEYVLRCLIGLGLIVGGRRLSRMLLHLRTAGTE